MVRRRFALVAFATAMLLAMAPAVSPSPAGAAGTQADPVPDGYEVTSSRILGPGLTHTVLRRVGPPEQVVHVARMTADAPFRLRAVLSNEAVAESGPRLERTTSMCARVRCAAAINADFAAVGADEPVGASVVDNDVVRSPVPTHHQFIESRDGSMQAAVVGMQIQLVPTDLRALSVAAVNRTRETDQIVLYTPANGPTTGTNPHGVELVLHGVPHPLAANSTATVRLAGLHDGGSSPLVPGTAVLSGHGQGADALRDLWARVGAGTVGAEAFLRIDMPTDARNSVGGTPVLVRNGEVFVADGPDQFVAGRHPRSIVGWTGDGDVLLVAVDGRQPGYAAGLTLPEAARLLVDLGAVEALNLDGGGSTTFVTAGSVVNQPSDLLVRRGGRDVVSSSARPGDTVLAHVERPVVSALAVVPVDASAAAAPVSAPRMPAVPASSVVHLAAADPASNPGGRWPAAALVVAPPQPPAALSALAALLLISAAAATVAVARRTGPAQASRATASAASSM